MVKRVRHLWNKTTCEVQFYLSSLPADAQKIGNAIRKHWGIENQAHWILDVTFNEDIAFLIHKRYIPDPEQLNQQRFKCAAQMREPL